MGECTAHNCENHASRPKKTTKIPPLSCMATQRMNLHAWLHQVHRGDFTPGPVNNHFTEDCFLVDMLKISQEIQGFLGKKAQLKPDAVPTIFSHKAVTRGRPRLDNTLSCASS